MKSWVDTLVARDNVWLVLTFHGVDGIGWEAKPHQELKEYFTYMKKHEENLWIAPFRDVTKYMRQKMAARINTSKKDDAIVVLVEHSLNKNLYNYPLTAKTYVPEDWAEISVRSGNGTANIKPQTDAKGSFVVYDILPGSPVTLTGS